jgi:acetylglutamate kinase
VRVVKLGGNELDRPGFLTDLAAALLAMPQEVVVVHGGGKAVDVLQQRLGIQPVKVGGMRVTDDESLQAVVMTLCGWINKRIVAELVGRGVDAVGLCGVDGGLLRVRKLPNEDVDLGWVGEITDVRIDILHMLLSHATTPVVAPVSLGPDNRPYNVNADQAAAAIASALHAETLDFVSNVEGIVIDGRLVPAIDQERSARLMAEGKINGGMVPKVRAAIEAMAGGVPAVRIVDLAGLPHEMMGTTLRAEAGPAQSFPSLEDQDGI